MYGCHRGGIVNIVSCVHLSLDTLGKTAQLWRHSVKMQLYNLHAPLACRIVTLCLLWVKANRHFLTSLSIYIVPEQMRSFFAQHIWFGCCFFNTKLSGLNYGITKYNYNITPSVLLFKIYIHYPSLGSVPKTNSCSSQPFLKSSLTDWVSGIKAQRSQRVTGGCKP